MGSFLTTGLNFCTEDSVFTTACGDDEPHFRWISPTDVHSFNRNLVSTPAAGLAFCFTVSGAVCHGPSFSRVLDSLALVNGRGKKVSFYFSGGINVCKLCA